MRATRKRELTTPDLVLLSLLAERPMHGYQANAELERREIRDWAGVSRPQVYYSLDKLASLGLIRDTRDAESAGGPERRVYLTSARGESPLGQALGREGWGVHRRTAPVFDMARAIVAGGARGVRGADRTPAPVSGTGIGARRSDTGRNQSRGG